MKMSGIGSGILNGTAFLFSLPGNMSAYAEALRELDARGRGSITEAYTLAESITKSPDSHSRGRVQAAYDYLWRFDE